VATVTVRCGVCGLEQTVEARVVFGQYPRCPKDNVPMMVAAAHGPKKIKCLSLRQPWAWAVIHANKRIENRIWNTHYRGPFLVHAARGYEDHDVAFARHFMVSKGLVAAKDIPPIDELPRGGIIGKTSLLEVINPRIVDGREQASAEEWYGRNLGADPRWHMPEQYGFILGPAEPLPFRPLRGMPGLFDVRDSSP
jgi:hypothetical protein